MASKECSAGEAARSERTVEGLSLRIDPDLCVGFGDCVSAAPEAFELDEDGIAVFVRPEMVSRTTLLEACESCPVDAITVFDRDGEQIVP